MYILSFDTTGVACSILLSTENEVLDKFTISMDFGQSEVLLPEIKKMLEKRTLKFKDINLILVCVGPGSFTGVRSSVSVARTFLLANPNVYLGGVTAFDAYLKELNSEDAADINAVIIETKREDFYVQLYDYNFRKINKAQSLKYDDIMLLLKGHKVSLIGDGVERFLNKPSGLSLHCLKIKEHLDIETIWRTGMEHYQNKCLDYPKPLYLRAPDITYPKK